MVRGPLGEICCGCSSLVKVIASALGSQERVTGVTDDSFCFYLHATCRSTSRSRIGVLVIQNFTILVNRLKV